MLKYYPDRYKIQEISDKTVDTGLPVLKFVPDWLVTSNMIEKLGNVIFSNYDVVFGGMDSVWYCYILNNMNLNNNINLDDDKFDYYDSETIDHLRFMAWWKTYKHHNHGKRIIKELMSAAWHPTRWWEWSMTEYEQK